MKQIKNNSKLFLLGSAGYGTIEVLWRGYTHWTMLVTGGLCFLTIYHFNIRNEKLALWKKCLFGSAAITSYEFVVGCIVNLWLKWDVWDYSSMLYNVKGQICPLYSALWFLLSAPLCGLTTAIRHKMPQRSSMLGRKRIG